MGGVMLTRKRRHAIAAAFTMITAAFAGGVPAQAAPSHHRDRGHACRNGYVGLTFDDGPSATLPQLLGALRVNRLRATMFNQGNNALARPGYVRDELRAGMGVGNHPFSPPHLPQLGEPQAFEEIASTQWVLRDIT